MAQKSYTACDLCPDDGQVHVAVDHANVSLIVSKRAKGRDLCEEHLQPILDWLGIAYTPSANGHKQVTAVSGATVKHPPGNIKLNLPVLGSVRVLTTGRYRAIYKDMVGGKQKELGATFDTIEEAERWLLENAPPRKNQHRVQQPKKKHGGTVTLGDYTCPDCNAKWTSLQALNMHLIRQHGITKDKRQPRHTAALGY